MPTKFIKIDDNLWKEQLDDRPFREFGSTYARDGRWIGIEIENPTPSRYFEATIADKYIPDSRQDGFALHGIGWMQGGDRLRVFETGAYVREIAVIVRFTSWNLPDGEEGEREWRFGGRIALNANASATIEVIAPQEFAAESFDLAKECRMLLSAKAELFENDLELSAWEEGMTRTFWISEEEKPRNIAHFAAISFSPRSCPPPLDTFERDEDVPESGGPTGLANARSSGAAGLAPLIRFAKISTLALTVIAIAECLRLFT